MHTNTIVSVAISALGAFCAQSALAAYGYTETWEAGHAAFWVGASTWTEVSAEPSNGNPGGFLLAMSQEPNPAFAGIQTLKPQFTGDYVYAGVSSVSADVRVISGNISTALFRVRFSDQTNGWAFVLPVDQIGISWTNLSAPIDPTWTDAEAEANGWLQEAPGDPSWQETMTHVNTLAFRAFGGPGEWEMGYDNFTIQATAPPCPADQNGDGHVDATDLARLLTAWGPNLGHPADILADGDVNAADLAQLLSNWGQCPQG